MAPNPPCLQITELYTQLCTTVQQVVVQRRAMAAASAKSAAVWSEVKPRRARAHIHKRTHSHTRTHTHTRKHTRMQVKARLRRWMSTLSRARCDGVPVRMVDEAARREFLEFTIIDPQVIATLSPSDKQNLLGVQEQVCSGSSYPRDRP